MKKKTILIVDDEATNLKLIKAMLMREGYHFITALSGKEALEIAKDTVPDLILLDVMMPGINGFEVCRRLKVKNIFKDVPILIVTALTETEQKVKAMEAGADDFISKPLDRTELLIRVKSLLRIKSYHDDLQNSYDEVSRKNNQLQEMEKVKDGLTDMIIHDLNNIFMVINGNLKLLSAETRSNQINANNYISICQNCSSDATQMVQGLLDIQKMEEGRLIPVKQTINLETLVINSLEPMEQLTKENGISLILVKPVEKTLVDADPGLIKRVLANLLNNAIRHTPNGGEIKIETNQNHQNKNICLSVKDNGDGLLPEYHEKIFEKFEQVILKERGIRRGSAGLGLTFCKMAVEAHNGKISVESKGKDQGCTFKVVLPALTKQVTTN